MELRQIKYFLAVAEELHFGKAAKKIGIAQPALSQQIRQLEQELGGLLLLRTKRHVSLTNAGNILLTEARPLIHQAEQAKELTQRALNGLVGTLRIGFVESATCDILPQVLSIYKKNYPDVKISLYHLHTSKQLEALHDDRIDIGIIGLPVNDHKIEIRVIKRETYWVALPPEHKLSCKPEISIKDLTNEPFVVTARDVGPIYYDSMIKVCMEAGFSPVIVQTANELQTLLSLVSCEMGIALIHESAKNFRSNLVYRPLQDVKQDAYQLSFAWKKGTRSPVVYHFLETANEWFPS